MIFLRPGSRTQRTSRVAPLLSLLLSLGACAGGDAAGAAGAERLANDSTAPTTDPGAGAHTPIDSGTGAGGGSLLRVAATLDAASTAADATRAHESDEARATSDAGGADAGGPPIPFGCPGGSITAGMNSLTVGGKARTFYADLPSDPSKPMGVLFSWHGFNDSLTHHRQIAGLDPNANPALPVVVITPDDTGLPPPTGLDWDIGRGARNENPDLLFFEAMLGCLHAQLPIDSARIYSFGFSAGSVMSSLLHSVYPELISAVVAASGGWFNDPAQAKLVNWLTVKWGWPALDPHQQGAVLLTHGGPSDVAVFSVFDLEKAAEAAFPFLRAHNRVVIDCAHDRGHALHPEVTGSVVSRFISAHRAGTPSPYRSGGYAAADYPSSCQLRLP